jgi:hypothetical protein
MRKNTVLSNLSLAAIALFVAAFPCFAQTQSNESRGESAGTIAAAGSGLMLAFNRTSPAPRVNASFVQPKATLEIAPVRTSSTFSPAAFMNVSQSSGQFTRDNRLVISTQVPVYEATTISSRPQFNVDNYVPSERPVVTFVPSRHPWLPSPMPNPN